MASKIMPAASERMPIRRSGVASPNAKERKDGPQIS
jgi:hypothetical protein